MARFFEEHKHQKAVSLCGRWDFGTDPLDIGESEEWFLGLPRSESVTVPSVWNTKLGLLEYEGVAWYQKKFYCEGGKIKLHFGAVMTKADIWIDGERLEGHYGGFCEFDRICTVTEGYHTLTVRADNRFDEHSVPQKSVDWYHYGGITRDVYYERLAGIVVLGNHFEYALSNDLSQADCYFKIKLYNAERKKITTRLNVRLGDECVFSSDVTLAAEEYLIFTTPRFTTNNVRLWNVGYPELYTVEITTDSYDVYDRIGFRYVEIKDGMICINGKPIEIRGVNRHEDHPDFGMAFPVSLMGRDLDIFTEMGGNSIRGSHYPNNREFLDMLDERGITFWSEIPVWGVGFKEATLGDEVVVSRILAMHEEMIEHYYNHPSIIIWGMHNEIKSDTQNAYALTKKCYELIKPIGGNRLITHASCNPFGDICFEFNDFISINIYYGWYNGDLESWDEFARKFRQRRAELGMENKPVLMSEFGAAAIYGNHTFDNIRWSEEYQAALIEKCLNLFHTDDMFCGFYIWQFCNIRTSAEMGLNRARGFNNKGILDEYRRPKMAYFKVKELFNSFKQGL